MKKIGIAFAALLLLLACGAAKAQQYPCPLTIQPRIVPDSTYTITTNDMCWLVIFTNPGAVTVKLPSPGLIFPPTFKTTLLPIDGATLTLTGLPDDAGRIHNVNGQTTLALAQGAGAVMQIEQDYNWYALPTGGISFPTIPDADLLGGDGGQFVAVSPDPPLLVSGGALSISQFTDVASGIVPASGGGTTNFLRADGAWANPAGCPGDTDATAVLFTDGSDCVGEVPNFTYSTTHGQVRIINKETVTNDGKDPAALIVESPDVNLHGAIQFGVSNLSGSGAWGEVGFQDAGDARDGPYSYWNTSDGSPLMLGSMLGALGAPRVGINYTGCMIADVQCAHGDLQIFGHRDDHEAGSQYWALVFGDGAATQGGFKIDGGGWGYLDIGHSVASTFTPFVHIAQNGKSYINGFGTTPYLGVGTNAPGTMLDVNGDITDRAVLSCVNGLQTDSGGKLICGSGSGGAVVATGALTANQIIIGAGGSQVSPLGSLGTTTTVLHGNASGPPSFGAVNLAADVTGNLPVANLNGGSGASSSTFWRGDGTWGAPSGATPGLGAGTTLTASASAALQWTGLTAGKYRLIGYGLTPASNGKMGMQVGTGGGPTWDSGAHYNNMGTEVHTGSATVTGVTSFSQTDWTLQQSNQLSGAYTTFSVDIDISVSGVASFVGNMMYQGSDGNSHGMSISGLNGSAGAPVTGIQIFYESGIHITSGSATLYKYN